MHDTRGRRAVSTPTAVLALVAVLVALSGTSFAAATLAANSVGSKQLKKNAVKSSKVKDGSLVAADFATGQLPAGPPGPPGASGAPGSARGYGWIDPASCVADGALCTVLRGKNVARVLHSSEGTYCVRVTGTSSATDMIVATVEHNKTDNPESTGTVEWDAADTTECPGGDFELDTQRIDTIAVRNAAGSGTEVVLDDDDSFADGVSFTFMVP